MNYIESLFYFLGMLRTSTYAEQAIAFRVLSPCLKSVYPKILPAVINIVYLKLF